MFTSLVCLCRGLLSPLHNSASLQNRRQYGYSRPGWETGRMCFQAVWPVYIIVGTGIMVAPAVPAQAQSKTKAHTKPLAKPATATKAKKRTKMTGPSEDHLYSIAIKPEGLICEDSPGFAEAKVHFEQGCQKQAQNQLEDAVASYRLAYEKCPDMYEAHYNTGLCLEAKGLDAEAVRSFDKAAQLNRTYKPIFQHLARLYERLGDKMQAQTNRAIYNQL